MARISAASFLPALAILILCFLAQISLVSSHGLATGASAPSGPGAEPIRPPPTCRLEKPRIDPENWECIVFSSWSAEWVHQGDLHLDGDWLLDETDVYGEYHINGSFSLIGSVIFKNNSRLRIQVNETLSMYRRTQADEAPKDKNWIRSPDFDLGYGDYNLVADWESYSNWPERYTGISFGLYGKYNRATHSVKGDAYTYRFIYPTKYSSYCTIFKSRLSASEMSSHILTSIYISFDSDKRCVTIPYLLIFSAIILLAILIYTVSACCICKVCRK